MCDGVADARLVLLRYLWYYYRISYDHDMCDTTTKVKIPFQKWSGQCCAGLMVTTSQVHITPRNELTSDGRGRQN